MGVWSGDRIQQPGFKNCFPTVHVPHGTFFFLAEWHFSTDNCIWFIRTIYNETFAYFKFEINFLPLALLFKVPKRKTLFPQLQLLNAKVTGSIWHHTLWGEALDSDCDSLLKESFLSQTWIWRWWNLLNISVLSGNIRWFSSAAVSASTSFL